MYAVVMILGGLNRVFLCFFVVRFCAKRGESPRASRTYAVCMNQAASPRSMSKIRSPRDAAQTQDNAASQPPIIPERSERTRNGTVSSSHAKVVSLPNRIETSRNGGDVARQTPKEMQNQAAHMIQAREPRASCEGAVAARLGTGTRTTGNGDS
jgi:hypothetical protein